MEFPAIVLLFFAFGMIVAGWFIIGRSVWSRIRSGQSAKISAYAAMMMVATYVLAAPQAQAQSDISLDFDLTPLFNAINQYLPVFLAVFGIVGGIAAAMVLSRFVVNAVITAFSGGKI